MVEEQARAAASVTIATYGQAFPWAGLRLISESERIAISVYIITANGSIAGFFLASSAAIAVTSNI